MGAWIEIAVSIKVDDNATVALFMGAWIENIGATIFSLAVCVALFMGAWIEISSQHVCPIKSLRSHSSWVRGLKFLTLVFTLTIRRRTLHGCVD